MAADLERLREEHVEAVMALARRVVRSDTPEDSPLVEMCDYHLQTGGKRLRATLPLAVAEALETPPGRLHPFAAACELLHNATLVHDDLQDGDGVRRGEPAVWKAYGPEHAINLGDAMLYWPLRCLDRLEVPDGMYRRCVRRFVRQTLAVIDGQEREFELVGATAPTRDAYVQMVEGKTAGLFVLAGSGAAEIAGASDPIVRGLEEAMTELGILFQIQDDVLDLYGEKGREERGADIREGKVSALVVEFLDRASPERAKWLRSLLRADRGAIRSEQIEDVAEAFRSSGTLDAVLDEIERRKEAALQTAALSDSEPLRSLVGRLSGLFVAPIAHLLSPDDAANRP